MNLLKSAMASEKLTKTANYFIFSGEHILVEKESDHQWSIPVLEKGSALELQLTDTCFLGTMAAVNCYCAHIVSERVPASAVLIHLRSLWGKVDPEVWHIAGYARQIYDWNRNFKYCGRCGVETRRNDKEHARDCPECGLVSYPRVSPAIITAVVKEDQILLARGVRFPDKKMFSVLAGFVEPGEDLEACLSREIFEEVGVRVKHIRYFKSQPWPFPDSLMIGFTAEYDSGSLVIDREEIAEAGWFKKDALPRTPGKYTLAGELIDWFVRTKG